VFTGLRWGESVTVPVEKIDLADRDTVRHEFIHRQAHARQGAASHPVAG
jgi:hypothetical protein